MIEVNNYQEVSNGNYSESIGWDTLPYTVIRNIAKHFENDLNNGFRMSNDLGINRHWYDALKNYSPTKFVLNDQD